MRSEALLSDEYFFGDRLNTGSKLKFLSTWIYQDAFDWHILTTNVCPDFHSDSTKNPSFLPSYLLCVWGQLLFPLERFLVPWVPPESLLSHMLGVSVCSQSKV